MSSLSLSLGARVVSHLLTPAPPPPRPPGGHVINATRAVSPQPIAVNEGHFAVGVIDYDTIAVAKQHNITLVSFSSLAAGVPGDHPTITAVASRHNVSNAAVMLKYGTFDIVDHSLVSRLHARREPYSTWCPRMHSTCVRMLIG